MWIIFCFHAWRFESKTLSISPKPLSSQFCQKKQNEKNKLVLRLLPPYKYGLRQRLVFENLFGVLDPATDSHHHSNLHYIGFLLTISWLVLARSVYKGLVPQNPRAITCTVKRCSQAAWAEWKENSLLTQNVLYTNRPSGWSTSTKWPFDQDSHWLLKVTQKCQANTSSRTPCQILLSASREETN